MISTEPSTEAAQLQVKMDMKFSAKYLKKKLYYLKRCINKNYC